MTKLTTLLSFTLLVTLLPTLVGIAAEESDKKECKCPVAGKAITVDTAGDSTEYKDATVYFCCGGCKAKFEAGKEKFATKANMQLVATKQAKQVKCPIAGRPVNDAQSIKVDNVTVGFCCGGCKGKASSAEGDEQLALLFGEKAFAKGFEVIKK
ncbi:MAG: hypothetical protein R3C05_06430 [Pirellulaceae bacterium]